MKLNQLALFADTPIETPLAAIESNWTFTVSVPYPTATGRVACLHGCKNSRIA